MRKIQQLLSIIIIAIGCLICQNIVTAEEQWPQAPEISAASAIVIETESGAILYEKNVHDHHYPASITKIMTTMLAIENCPLSDIVTFSNDAVNKVEGSMVGINPGEQLTLNQCLYGVMLASGNEMAYAVAEHVGGSYEQFVKMMNDKAAALGCQDTHFNNPHGLPDENHYTSAYDMGLIARAAFQNENFRTICGTKYYTIPPTNLWAEERGIPNHHKMLTNSSYHYDYCVGGKTGYTNAARYTLVTYARKDDLTLVCVIMQDEESSLQYLDTTNLLNYGFQNFYKTTLSENEIGLNLNNNGLFPLKHSPFIKQESDIIFDDAATLVLPNTIDASALTYTVSYDTPSNETVAELQYAYGDHLVGTIPILYEAPKAGAGSMLQVTPTPAPQQSKAFFRINLRIILYIILGVIALMLLIWLIIKLIVKRFFASGDYINPKKYKKLHWK